jgi:transposase-like protein|tara:strand:- start:296 stop:604 length:309 start_codon:yes stop_codon:yes gene_type:complete
MVVCPICKHKKTVSKIGTRSTKLGKKQRFYCSQCNKSFIPNTPFKKRHYSKKVIKDAVDIYRAGASLAETRKALWKLDHVHVARYTISRWFKRFFWVFRKRK